MSKNKGSAINVVFVFFVVAAILYGASRGQLKEVTDASFASAKSAVELCIGLIGIMALWLGFVRILEVGGLMYSLAEFVRPYVKKLFPDVPAGHPAMSAMLLNMSANALGLGNAATPLGLKAMSELNKLNPIKGTATNAMCLFLAINTSGLTLLPLGVIGVRAAAGCAEPAAIFIPTLLATCASTIVAILVACFFAKRDKRYLEEIKDIKEKADDPECFLDIKKDNYDDLKIGTNIWYKISGYLILAAMLCILIYQAAFCTSLPELKKFIISDVLTNWLMPCLMLLIISYGLCHGVKIYEALVDGAKQGFEIAVKIIPFLVAILVAIGMFRASGAMDILTNLIGPYTSIIGLPADVVPMALLRPLSGSGAFAVMSEIIVNGPDTYSAYVASILNGCTETTFYVIAVYFGSVGVIRVRHALIAGLTADLTGIVVASLLAKTFWPMG